MIIRNTSQIISEIIEIEKKKIDDFELKISHAPTIGKQFEGLTLKALKTGIPSTLNVKVVSGFIVGSNGIQSGQIDCMICTGEGIRVPSTDEYIYNISNVLAVIEIKKNLFTNELDSAYHHLLKVRGLENELDLIPRDLVDFIHGIFAKVSGKIIHKWEDSFKLNNEFLEKIYHGLVSQFFSPLRIIIGYDGFSTEASLRKKYTDFIVSNQSSHKIIKGFGPFSFPDLIICGESCLTKLNGEPYLPYIENDYLEFYTSSSGHNITILTELILARLSRYAPINFEDDDKREPLKYFLACVLVEEDGLKGWEYRYHDLDFNSEKVANHHTSSDWQPIFVSDDAYLIFHFLLSNDLTLTSDIYTQTLNNNPNILNELLETRCVALDSQHIKLTTTMLRCAILPDGRNAIGEDLNGYFTKWVSKNYTKILPLPFLKT